MVRVRRFEGSRVRRFVITVRGFRDCPACPSSNYRADRRHGGWRRSALRRSDPAASRRRPSTRRSGSILIDSTCLAPLTTTVTMPPPAVASTRVSAMRFCICSCICLACCIIVAMFMFASSLQFFDVPDFRRKHVQQIAHRRAWPSHPASRRPPLPAPSVSRLPPAGAGRRRVGRGHRLIVGLHLHGHDGHLVSGQPLAPPPRSRRAAARTARAAPCASAGT